SWLPCSTGSSMPSGQPLRRPCTNCSWFRRSSLSSPSLLPCSCARSRCGPHASSSARRPRLRRKVQKRRSRLSKRLQPDTPSLGSRRRQCRRGPLLSIPELSALCPCDALAGRSGPGSDGPYFVREVARRPVAGCFLLQRRLDLAAQALRDGASSVEPAAG